MAGEKKFAVFDIDGTLIRWQLYHAVADATVKLGYVAPVIYQPVREARMAWKRRGGGDFKDYELKLIQTYEEVLKSLNFDQFEAAINDVFEEYKDQIYIYTRDLIAKLKEDGYLLFAISGSQTEIVAKLADFYGFDDYTGTVYGRGSKGFTGQKTVGSHHKDRALKDMASRNGAGFAGSLAVGDSLSDAAMFKLVEQPIAFNPEKALFELATKEGWKIVLERKNMIYELEKADGRYQVVKTNAG